MQTALKIFTADLPAIALPEPVRQGLGLLGCTITVALLITLLLMLAHTVTAHRNEGPATLIRLLFSPLHTLLGIAITGTVIFGAAALAMTLVVAALNLAVHLSSELVGMTLITGATVAGFALLPVACKAADWLMSHLDRVLRLRIAA